MGIWPLLLIVFLVRCRLPTITEAAQEGNLLCTSSTSTQLMVVDADCASYLTTGGRHGKGMLAQAGLEQDALNM